MDSNKKRSGGKRAAEPLDSPGKRIKSSVCIEEETRARNFNLACKEVSSKDYYDNRSRFLLVCLPSCLTICNHQGKDEKIKQMSTFAEESFRTEFNNNMWYDALEVCHMSLTETRYLSSDILQLIVEILLNVHDDKFSDYSAKYTVSCCQQILLRNFSMHPPCLNKKLRDCYINFLKSPMVIRNKTATIRSRFGYDEGIVKYCLNLLDYELSADSADGSIVHKNIPEDLKKSVSGYHLQKQMFEIYETLDRPERIERLFIVLETIIELLQFDLAIEHSRYSTNRRRHMRSRKLMEYILWSDTNTIVGDNCRQILKIFANMIHLQYPESMVKIITTWLNTMIQTLYTREANSNCDYPNTSKCCIVFAQDFYAIIGNMPHDSIIRILERIEPVYMRHIVGLFHLNYILSINEGCIFKILSNFVRESQWKSYPSDRTKINISKKLFSPPEKVKNKISFLLTKCEKDTDENRRGNDYLKVEPKMQEKDVKVSLNHIVHSLYLTLKASLDAVNLQSVIETWDNLNRLPVNESVSPEHGYYQVTNSLVHRYKYNLEAMNELSSLFNDVKNREPLPEVLKIFGDIELLHLHF